MTNYYDPQRYWLVGPQVEPGAAHWTFAGEMVRVVDIHNLHPDDLPNPYDMDAGLLENDLQELAELAGLRDEPDAIAGTFTATPPQGKPYGRADKVDRTRAPLSVFFRRQPPPITSQIDIEAQRPIQNVVKPCLDSDPLVRTGGELARLFEDETPGLLHRHALNCLLYNRNVSPPRQARIWMALDVAIYSALLAAWHIKWGHSANGAADYSRVYRERPITWETRVAEAEGRAPRYQVLFDTKLTDQGKESGMRRCPEPFPSPGTPRHPAYPSGHSTYSAAASKVLAHFFPQEQEELMNLADNIGVARLWGGVHWRQDHTAGRLLGEWVADQVIKQLCLDPVQPLPGPEEAPDRCDGTIPAPSFEKVEETKAYRQEHDRGNCEADQDTIPPPRDDPQAFHGQRGGQ